MGENKQIRRYDRYFNWNKESELELKEAVKNFNNKLDKLQEQELNVHLPEEASYKDLRSRIKTKREFNRQLKNLRDFQESTAEEIYVTKGGLEITKWEKDVIEQAANTVVNRRNKDLESLAKGSYMGSESYSQATASKNKAKNLLNKLNLANLSEAREYVKTTGTADFNFRQAENYKRTYLTKVLPQFKNMEGYEKLKETLESKNNPLEFYEYLKNSEYLRDIDQFYPENVNIIYAGDNQQEMFNKALEQLEL